MLYYVTRDKAPELISSPLLLTATRQANSIATPVIDTQQTSQDHTNQPSEPNGMYKANAKHAQRVVVILQHCYCFRARVPPDSVSCPVALCQRTSKDPPPPRTRIRLTRADTKGAAQPISRRHQGLSPDLPPPKARAALSPCAHAPPKSFGITQ